MSSPSFGSPDLKERPDMTFLLCALVSFSGSFIQSACGFGYAIVCMSFWPLLMDFHTASMLESLTALLMVFTLAVRLHKAIDYRLLLPAAASALLGNYLGIRTQMSLSDSILRRILGIVLLLLLVYFLFLSGKLRLHRSPASGFTVGGLSGFLGGLFNIGGPPMVAYFLSVCEDKETYHATLQTYFCITSLSVFANHIASGNLTASVLPLCLSALLGTGIGTLLGFLLFRKMSMPGLRKFVYLFMAVSGIYLTFIVS